MEQITIGTVVKLKSGSPHMTVIDYGIKHEGSSVLVRVLEDKDQVTCQWFDATGTLQENKFPIASLQLGEQPTRLKRIDGHYIVHEIEHVLHFERGILFTIRELIINPGQNIKNYLSENRSRLVKPIIFVIITSLIYSLSINFFHIEDQYIKFEGGELNTPVKIFKWIQAHYGYANIIMGIFITLWLKLFFRKYHYNIFEILILLCFVMGIGMLIYSLFALLEGLANVKLMAIGGMIGIGYCSWAIGHFFGRDKILNYVKAFFAYILGMITFTFSAIVLGFLVDLVTKH